MILVLGGLIDVKKKKNSDYLFAWFCQLCPDIYKMVYWLKKLINWLKKFSLKKDEFLAFDTEFLCKILKKFTSQAYICFKDKILRCYGLEQRGQDGCAEIKS